MAKTDELASLIRCCPPVEEERDDGAVLPERLLPGRRAAPAPCRRYVVRRGPKAAAHAHLVAKLLEPYVPGAVHVKSKLCIVSA